MKKKTALLVFVVILFILGSVSILYYLSLEDGPPSSGNMIEIDSDFNLSSNETPLIGCILGIRDEISCYNKQGNFQKADFLDNQNELNSLGKGFVLLTLDDGIFTIYDFDIDSIFENWYEEIDLDGDSEMFFYNIGEEVHVDLYNLMQWRVVQKRKGEIELENILDELRNFKTDGLYVIMSPMRSSDMDLICESDEELCHDFERYISIPSQRIVSLTVVSDWEYGDMFNDWGLIRTLVLGANTLNPSGGARSEEAIQTYDILREDIKNSYSHLEDSEIEFIGTFLPLGLISYWSDLYYGWSDDFTDHYYYLIDLYSDKAPNLGTKLNILYNEI